MLASALVRRVLPDVPECPDVMVEQAIMDAALDFISYTQAWQDLTAAIPLVDEQTDYALTPPANGRVDQVARVWCNTRELSPVSLSRVAEVAPDWQTTGSSEPTHYTAVGGDVIRVYPTPRATTGSSIRALVTYAPTNDAVEFPDAIGNQYRDAIICGAKSRLLMMRNRKWTDPVLAAQYGKVFEDEKVSARIEAIHSQTPGTMTVRPVLFR